MSTRRTIAVGAGSATLLTALFAMLAWVWWIPSAVRGEVEAVAARRGLRAEVASVELSFSDLTLRGVRVSSEDVLSLDVREIHTGAGLFELGTSGSAAIRHLRIVGARLSVDLDAPSLSSVLESVRGPRSGGDEAAPGGRIVEVEDLAIAARDRDGMLLRADAGAIRMLSDGVLRASMGATEVAMDEEDGLRVESSELRLQRDGEHGWQISSSSARGVAIRYRERASEERSPLWDRLRRHARLARRLARESSEPDPVPEADSPDPEATEGAASSLTIGALETIGPRLAAGAELRLEGLSVTARSEEGREQRVLRDLEAQISKLPRGRYRFEGSGRPGRGGRLGWDLSGDPERLVAEGNVDFQRLPFVLLVPVLPRLPWHHPEEARVSGALTIRSEGATRVHLEGHAELEDLALSSPRIAPRPVERIGLSVSGEADWVPLDRRLEVTRAEVGVGEARAQLSGSFEWPEDHYLVDLRGTLPPTDCNTAVSAIPADLLAEATAFTFRGNIGGQVVARIDSRDLEATVLTIDVADGCTFLTAPGFADVVRFTGPFVHRVIEPDGTTFEMETGPGTDRWTPLSRISPFLIHAVLGHEDSGFFRHSGFATHAIRLALIRNLTEGRYVYGASTLTMQLVKNVFLHREKTLARKVQEVLLTWWIESVMPKEQILELYLNVIEYGPQIYGIRAAGEHYFGRVPSELGPAESAYLATILPNPKAFHSHWEENALPDRHRRRVERFLRTLGSRGRYDEDAVSYGLEQLATLRFHRVGDPLPAEPEHRGHTAPLPIVPTDLDEAWDDELGPDDPDPPADDEEVEEEENVDDLF